MRPTVLPEQQKLIDDWLADRPKLIQDMAAQCPPVFLYKLTSTGSYASIISYSEDRTVTVQITREFNYTIFERQVFGIKLEDLEAVCNIEDADEYRTHLPDEVSVILEGVEDELQQLIPKWHQEIPDEIKGQDRAALIANKVQEYLTQQHNTLETLGASSVFTRLMESNN